MQTEEDFQIRTGNEYRPLLLSRVLDSNSIASHPRIQALYQEAKIAEQSKNVERASGLPDFSIGYSNQSLTGYQNINQQEIYFNAAKRFQSMNFGISIPITYGATKSRIRSLEYQKQSSEAAARWQQEQLETDLKNAWLQYEQAVSQYNYFRNQALPNAGEIVESGQLSYKTGDISHVEYLFGLQTATDIQLKYLQSVWQINQSVIYIMSLINQ